MERMLIIGFPGGGKTILAKQIGEILHIPVHHCDRIKRIENWQMKPNAEIHQLVNQVIDQDKWILDGYPTTAIMPACIDRADTLIFVDLNRILCMWRVTKRTIKNRGKVRDDVGDGCKDGYGLPTFLYGVIWTHPKKYRPTYVQWLATEGKNAYHFKSRRQIRKFINKLSKDHENSNQENL